MKNLGHRKRILASLRMLPDDERWSQDVCRDNSLVLHLTNITNTVSVSALPVHKLVFLQDWKHDSIDGEDEAEDSPLEKLSLFRDYTQLRYQCPGDDTSEDALSDELVLDNNGVDFDSPVKVWIFNFTYVFVIYLCDLIKMI